MITWNKVLKNLDKKIYKSRGGSSSWLESAPYFRNGKYLSICICILTDENMNELGEYLKSNKLTIDSTSGIRQSMIKSNIEKIGELKHVIIWIRDSEGQKSTLKGVYYLGDLTAEEKADLLTNELRLVSKEIDLEGSKQKYTWEDLEDELSSLNAGFKETKEIGSRGEPINLFRSEGIKTKTGEYSIIVGGLNKTALEDYNEEFKEIPTNVYYLNQRNNPFICKGCLSASKEIYIGVMRYTDPRESEEWKDQPIKLVKRIPISSGVLTESEFNSIKDKVTNLFNQVVWSETPLMGDLQPRKNKTDDVKDEIEEIYSKEQFVKLMEAKKRDLNDKTKIKEPRWLKNVLIGFIDFNEDNAWFKDDFKEWEDISGKIKEANGGRYYADSPFELKIIDEDLVLDVTFGSYRYSIDGEEFLIALGVQKQTVEDVNKGNYTLQCSLSEAKLVKVCFQHYYTYEKGSKTKRPRKMRIDNHLKDSSLEGLTIEEKKKVITDLCLEVSENFDRELKDYLKEAMPENKSFIKNMIYGNPFI